MRLLLPVAVLCASVAAVALAAPQPPAISTSGVRLVVPVGWHAVVSKTPDCDPERLLVVSSAPIRFRPRGDLAAPGRGEVLLLVLEDRYAQDRPFGDLRRPKHFSVAWNKLVRLKSVCGLPDAPAFMRYFKVHGRYLGFIVYPGLEVGARTRAQTLAVMDSVHVSGREA
jgi:hypothetical protein